MAAGRWGTGKEGTGEMEQWGTGALGHWGTGALGQKTKTFGFCFCPNAPTLQCSNARFPNAPTLQRPKDMGIGCMR